jgi:hypothetical protein
MKGSNLLEKFVNSFEKLDEMSCFSDLDPIAYELRSEEQDEFGRFRWRVVPSATNRSALDQLYAQLPARFPPLYEQLVLSYRWAEVDLGSFRLVANLPGADLSGLLREISKDKGLWDALMPAGYIQFGKGPDVDYDPVCFEIKSRNKTGDYRIVKIDHEEILCNCRIKVVAELASDFVELVLQTIGRADGSKA